MVGMYEVMGASQARGAGFYLDVARLQCAKLLYHG